MTRPEDPIYAVDERPPLPRLIFLSAQDAALMSVYLVLIVIVFQRAEASHAATLDALSLGVIAARIDQHLARDLVWIGMHTFSTPLAWGSSETAVAHVPLHRVDRDVTDSIGLACSPVKANWTG